MIQYIFAAIFTLSICNTANALASDEEVLVFEKRTPTGRLEKRFRYYLKDGVKVKHGRCESFYDNGQLMTVVNYQHGKKNGSSTNYYEWIKTKNHEAEYLDGRQHGRSRWWSPEGKLLYESKWRDGVAVSGRVHDSGIHSGLSCEHRTVLYENGVRKPESEKKFKTSYERPASSNQLPDFQQFLRWNYPSYEYGSTYRFQYKLPLHKEIPEILAIRKTGGTKGDIVIDSQLETLTRVEPKFGASDESKQTVWENWWTNVGSLYDDPTKVNVTQDEEAWRIACKGRELPLPEASVVLPKTYTLTFTFGGGDYGGICEEKMVLERTASKATLTRTYSTKTNGPKIKEHWQGMSIEQADTTTRAIGHVIDHPWLQNDEVEINQMYWEIVQKNKESPKQQRGFPFRYNRKSLIGRESFSRYYASSKYELKDGSGNLWWNADPRLWYGANEKRYNWSSANEGGIYSFFIEQYPESQKADGEKPGWKAE